MGVAPNKGMQATASSVRCAPAARLRAQLLETATRHGLDVREPSPDDPWGGTHYADLMTAVAHDLYPADATEDQAIAAVVDVVRHRHGLDRPPPAPERPTTIAEALRQHQHPAHRRVHRPA